MKSYTISINKKYLNVMMNLIIFEIMGFLGIITVIVYFLHSDNTTFEIRLIICIMNHSFGFYVYYLGDFTIHWQLFYLIFLKQRYIVL